VHVGQKDIPATLARRLLGPDKIVGVSVGNVAQAKEAQSAGADYVGVGPCFPTASKKDARAPISLEVVRAVKESVHIPVVGIGGINEGNACEVTAAGADGVAVISAVVSAPDVEKAAHSVLAAVRAGKKQR
jgi:thiamine-phosphate pyrophosphorylase